MIDIDSFQRISFPLLLLNSNYLQGKQLSNRDLVITEYDDPFLKQHVSKIEISDIKLSQHETISVSESVFHYHVYQLQEDGPGTEELDEEDLAAANHWILPSRDFHGLWDSLVFDEDIKTRLLSYAATTLLFTDRKMFFHEASSYYISPPGTGKTSLCKALAQKLCIRLSDRFTYGQLVEINSHSLFSKWFSEILLGVSDNNELQNIHMSETRELKRKRRNTRGSSSSEQGDQHDNKDKMATSTDVNNSKSNKTGQKRKGNNKTFTPAAASSFASTHQTPPFVFPVEIVNRLNTIESKISTNKQLIDEGNSKILSIELSHNFLSDKYDTVNTATNNHEETLKKLQGEVKSISQTNKQLNDQNTKLKDDVTDLKCRSMRDNLVFLNISETSAPLPDLQVSPVYQLASADSSPMETASVDAQTTQSARSALGRPGPAHGSYASAVSTENCSQKILDYCESVQKIAEARSVVHIDRDHRATGHPISGKIRSIIVKFKDTDSNRLVKRATRPVNQGKNVFDQQPKEVQERRRELIPIMEQAKRENKHAYIARDKLYINHKLYTPTSFN
ncbi:PCH2-like protein [Mya arenaria]|uniref:PCH2-like protein n=1 Tax=Mya arenaria TaxID=6604 RepID=A0ABY7EPU3_MYAAR|nr:PCH2-like protein [Mya arenaria]